MAKTKATHYQAGWILDRKYFGEERMVRYRSIRKCTDHTANRNSPRECARRVRQMARDAGRMA